MVITNWREYWRKKRKESYRRHRRRMLATANRQNKYGREFLKIASIEKIKVLLKICKRYTIEELRKILDKAGII